MRVFSIFIVLMCHRQAYHSAFNEDPDIRQVGNMAVLPIKTKFRGPAPLGAHTLCSLDSTDAQPA